MEVVEGSGRPVKQYYQIIESDGSCDEWETDRYSEVVDSLMGYPCVEKIVMDWLESAQCSDGDFCAKWSEEDEQNFIFEKAEEAAAECGIRVNVVLRETDAV